MEKLQSLTKTYAHTEDLVKILGIVSKIFFLYFLLEDLRNAITYAEEHTMHIQLGIHPLIV